MNADAPLPLSSVRVLDLGLGLPAAIAVKLLADAGADVVRFEPAGGDPFYDIYPAYASWRRGERRMQGGLDEIMAQACTADICILGGEEHPDVDWKFDARGIASTLDRLVVLNLPGAPAGAAPLHAVEILAQARSGMCFEQKADGPYAYPLPIGGYGAAMHGAIAALAALWARRRTGKGALIEASLVHGALRWAASIWAQVERPPKSFNALFPRSAVPFRIETSDGGYLQLAGNVPGGLERLYQMLGIPGTPKKPGAQGGGDGAAVDLRTFFGDVDTIQPYAETWTRADLLAGVQNIGLPGAAILSPAEVWDDPQTVHNGVIASADGWRWVGLPVLVEPSDETPGAGEFENPPGPERGPLSGVKVVDFGCFAAGPHASVVLADLGADVIKLERLGGDPMRSGFHHYAASNRGKRSICVDAKSPEGAEVIRRLCAGADVVHHNFRPGVSARMGVDHSALAKVNPDVVVLESSAYGPTGPKAALPGFDSVFQAICGHMWGAGGVGNEPLSYRFAPMDYGTAVIGAFSMLLGLHLRRGTGRGSAINASLLNSGLFLLSEVVQRPDGRFAGAPMNGPQQLGVSPAESLYQTRDGWIAVAARGAAMARRFAGAVGAPLQAEKPVHKWRPADYEPLARALRNLTTHEALEKFAAAEVWAERCRESVAEVLHDPIEGAGALLVTQDPGLGEIRQVGTAVKFDGAEPLSERLGRVDPVGGHTREILLECGYAPAEIDDLLARGVVA